VLRLCWRSTSSSVSLVARPALVPLAGREQLVLPRQGVLGQKCLDVRGLRIPSIVKSLGTPVGRTQKTSREILYLNDVIYVDFASTKEVELNRF